jgi:nitrogen fixation NifU-like protein
MIDLIKGLEIEDALDLVETFIGMIKKEITDENELEKLEDAIAFQNISNMPARVKCAVLAWHTLKEALNKNSN